MDAQAFDVSFFVKCPHCGKLLIVWPSKENWATHYHRGIEVGEMEPAYTQSYYDMRCILCGSYIKVTF